MFLSSVFTDLFCLYDWPPMDEPLMACIFGGVLMGLSLGIVFLQGATTGGTDLIARLLKLKLRWLPMGKLLMAVDLAVILMVAAAFRTLQRNDLPLLEGAHQDQLVLAGEAALPVEEGGYLDSQIDGASVGFGGSMTVQEMGLYPRLAAHNDAVWHWDPTAPPGPGRCAGGSCSRSTCPPWRRRASGPRCAGRFWGWRCSGPATGRRRSPGRSCSSPPRNRPACGRRGWKPPGCRCRRC